MAWIYRHVFNDIDQALTGLSSMFNLRPTSRTFINIWKANFESPGRHFIYIQQYTHFFIELNALSNNIENVKLVLRKLKKCDDVLIDHAALCKNTIDLYIRMVHPTPFQPKTSQSIEALHKVIQELILSDDILNQVLPVLQELVDLKRMYVSVVPDNGLQDAIASVYWTLFEQACEMLQVPATSDQGTPVTTKLLNTHTNQLLQHFKSQ
jgi:hypothetical protein